MFSVIHALMASTPTDELDRRLHQFEDEFAALALQDALVDDELDQLRTRKDQSRKDELLAQQAQLAARMGDLQTRITKMKKNQQFCPPLMPPPGVKIGAAPGAQPATIDPLVRMAKFQPFPKVPRSIAVWLNQFETTCRNMTLNRDKWADAFETIIATEDHTVLYTWFHDKIGAGAADWPAVREQIETRFRSTQAQAEAITSLDGFRAVDGESVTAMLTRFDDLLTLAGVLTVGWTPALAIGEIRYGPRR